MNKPSKKERLDVILHERGLVPSRAKAQAMILAGQVRVRDLIVQKVGARVAVDDPIELVSGPKFVSRGGEKLDGAIEDFGVDVRGLQCLDVGASTGGFTDCLLKRGALRVVAVDVGKGQLDISLRTDPRVDCREDTHVLKLDALEPRPQVVVIDVSFISLKKVLPKVKQLAAPGATVLAMVKPQFEVGPKNLKKGVVRSEEIQRAAVMDVAEFAKKEGFYYLGETPARIKGPKGNQEYFLHLKA